MKPTMKTTDPLLVCWHSANHGLPVLTNALRALRNRRIVIRRVLYLVQEHQAVKPPPSIEGAEIEPMTLKVSDPTNHNAIYETVRAHVLPRLVGVEAVHINISPGTPAMHAVWMVLHAGGAFPPGTMIWSSQFNAQTQRTRIDEVQFAINTYLSEIRRIKQLEPGITLYDAQPRSAARRQCFERLRRYADVIGSPLLLLGERGTGKTRLVETFVAKLKRRQKVVTVACGGLDSTLAESALFGHIKGAFTGAAADRAGYLQEAHGGILFLDEVQDLPKSAQRKLVRTLQDHHRRFRRLGSDRESRADFELVCASNLSLPDLRTQLDADFFDRISHLLVTIPPLRECREDLEADWQAVWGELRRDAQLPEQAPWSDDFSKTLQHHPLGGNLRDLQRLALLTMAWSGKDALLHAVQEWGAFDTPADNAEPEFGQGTRQQHIRRFCRRLARWAKNQHGTWDAAAEALGCDEKTLRSDAGREPDVV
jgi:DNA-binding NtrC family response regulator